MYNTVSFGLWRGFKLSSSCTQISGSLCIYDIREDLWNDKRPSEQKRAVLIDYASKQKTYRLLDFEIRREIVYSDGIIEKLSEAIVHTPQVCSSIAMTDLQFWIEPWEELRKKNWNISTAMENVADS